MSFDYTAIMAFAEDKINRSERPKKQSFRNRFRHTKRVIRWAEKIHKIEGGDLEVIKIACIFHDVGWDNFKNHAIVSKDIANEYLSNIKYDNSKKIKVLEAIEYHNQRDEDIKLNKESLIVMDADILDEVGALSIVWDCMTEGSESNSSYKSAYSRIIKFSNYIKEQRNKLKTRTGKQLYEERIKVIDNFIKELEYELNL